MAQITKRLCLPVGQYFKQGADKPTIEYREIGYMMEFKDQQGNAWEEVRLHVDAFNPVLATLARSMMEKGSASARVKLFDLERKKKGPAAPEGATAEDDDIPFE